MKTFVLKIAAFFLMLVAGNVIYFFGYFKKFPSSIKTLSYFGSQESGKPNLILFGASNLVYNYDYEKLSATFDDFNVIANWEYEFRGFFPTASKLTALEQTAQDILIVTAPYNWYEEYKFLPLLNKANTTKISQKVIVNGLSYFPVLTVKSFFNISTSLNKDTSQIDDSTPVQLEFEAIPLAQYTPTYKDCWTNPEDKFTITSTTFDQQYLDRQYRWLRANFKGKIYFRFPAIRPNQYSINKKRIQYQEENFDFLNAFETAHFADSLWFDQWYHLNQCGRKVATERLINELRFLELVVGY